MLKKTSDNPPNYESDAPQKDFKRFEETMAQLVSPRRKRAKPEANVKPHKETRPVEK